MDHRIKIPALALLGLSFTECTKRDPARPIVGDWQAIEVGARQYPETYASGDYSSAIGVVMHIDDELAGELMFYIHDDSPLTSYTKEYGSDLIVEPAGASEYVVDVEYPFLDRPDYYYDDSSGYGSTGAPADDADDDIVHARPLVAGTTPDFAPVHMVLRCTLDQDTLTCDRDDDTAPGTFVFVRKPPEEP